MLAAVLAILAKVIVILKLGLRNIKKDNKSHIFKHLLSTATCCDSYNSLFFKTIDTAGLDTELNTFTYRQLNTDISRIAIPGSAEHERRCNEVIRTVKTLNQLTEALNYKSCDLKRSFFYLCMFP